MNNKNVESCVTPVTYPTLLERMRQRRLDGSDVVIDEKPIALPRVNQDIQEQVTKLQLPPLVISWLSICLGEGHMQPSQPSVGRLEGWPIRPYFKNSLYVDLECWCSKARIPPYLIPSRELFYQGTDAIFESISTDKYKFPDLEICRKKFSQLLKEGQYDESKTNNF
jgi:hypothetical protein